MSQPTSPQGSSATRKSWQDKLGGGRTAWSSTVIVQGQSFSARYWYDGQYINNAKEDAAEVALGALSHRPSSSATWPGIIPPSRPSPPTVEALEASE
ncbi:uncharacterized protein N7477_001577 [Penicillium maclennaniae]|uniref:uncharacterized protein n=1 Tax=Penicillium maclennaniae TaxID=1343394 RepID=UPI002541859C|nr:uncharacterized protein N7477_001577 [Penicillium maclennaniae]KAJ5681637.1 hypothetical protein N7477_001577 [Penicillium maclennaniae]